jgi:hypothetical protein
MTNDKIRPQCLPVKKLVILLCVAGAAVGALLLWKHSLTRGAASLPLSGHATGAPLGSPRGQAGGLIAASSPPLAAAPPSDSSDAERVAWLESLGQLPPGASLHDRWLAQRTSWWGKRLDPKEFWKGRVVWCDQKAIAAAHAHGRGYPPIPYADPGTKQFPDVDHRPIPSAEGFEIPYISSSREAVFWDYFNRTHPMPPERIDLYQTSAVKYRREDATFLGCPPEALSEEALHWAGVMKLRDDYRAALALPPGQVAAMTNYVLGQGTVDPKLITEPLPADQLRAANTWKIAYLQRLRRQKTDESYINAYLQAWRLSAAEVFGR